MKIKERSNGTTVYHLFIWITCYRRDCLLILADLGPSPWDVLHVGLYYKFGLTIGSWNVIAGFFILGVSAMISKSIPQFGAFLNMILVGLFIDMYLMIPFSDPIIIRKVVMFAVASYKLLWNGFYISKLGAGPRDSLMHYYFENGLEGGKVRSTMEFWFIGCSWWAFILGTIVEYTHWCKLRSSMSKLNKILKKLQKLIQIYQTYKGNELRV
jgi:uncharacterized membrane protein YczE